MKNKIIWISMVAVLSATIWFQGGCESSGQTGALLGTGVGALAGQAIGRDTKSTLIGAAIGGGTGYIFGSEKDKKEMQAEIRAAGEAQNIVTVNMTNSNGSISQVLLRRQGVGYVGPRGEYYNTLPTGEQLKPIYGF